MATVKINRLELLQFMNSGDPAANGHHTAMIGFLGEPLAVGLILHHLRRKNKQAKCVSLKVTGGQRKGSWLDAWIFDGEQTLYQTEIKMWGGNAIGGIHISPDADADLLSQQGESQWYKWIWDREAVTFRDDNVRKVLKPMQRPKDYNQEKYKIEPLLCLWWMVQADSLSEDWFTLELISGQFPPFHQVHIFSLTRYVMSLSEDILELEMPLLSERLTWLRRLFPEYILPTVLE